MKINLLFNILRLALWDIFNATYFVIINVHK